MAVNMDEDVALTPDDMSDLTVLPTLGGLSRLTTDPVSQPMVTNPPKPTAEDDDGLGDLVDLKVLPNLKGLARLQTDPAQQTTLTPNDNEDANDTGLDSFDLPNLSGLHRLQTDPIKTAYMYEVVQSQLREEHGQPQVQESQSSSPTKTLTQNTIQKEEEPKDETNNTAVVSKSTRARGSMEVLQTNEEQTKKSIESEIFHDLFTEIMEIELIKEIIRNENEYRKYVKQQMYSRGGDRARNRRTPTNYKDEDQRDSSNASPNDNGDDNAPNDNNDAPADDGDDDNDEDKEGDEKDDGEDMYSLADIEKVLEKVESLKKRKEYKIMVAKNNPLTKAEMIALCYYTDYGSACRKMKRYHRGLLNSMKWKQLYFYTTQAIERLYEVFHFENKTQPQISYLFHGDEEPEFDKYSKASLSPSTFISYTTQYHIALRFALGSMWVVGNVHTNLYSAKVRGANVQWISKHNEQEYILLPGTYWNWKLLSADELQNRQWALLDLNVYMTNEYASNENSLGVHRNYDDLNEDQNRSEHEFKKCFYNMQFGNKTKTYYAKMVELGYADFETMIELKDDALNEIEMKKPHKKKFKKKINALKESMNKYQTWIIEKQGMEYYADAMTNSGIVTFQIFYDRFRKYEDILKVIGSQNVKDAKKLWNNSPKNQ
eukprot:481023_1